MINVERETKQGKGMMDRTLDVRQWSGKVSGVRPNSPASEGLSFVGIWRNSILDHRRSEWEDPASGQVVSPLSPRSFALLPTKFYPCDHFSLPLKRQLFRFL